jgi:hypothetical protein
MTYSANIPMRNTVSNYRQQTSELAAKLLLFIRKTGR